jgi:aminopeptidase YwaD
MNDPIEQKILSEIHGRNTLMSIEQICEFGDRFVGTTGDQKTFKYFRDHYKEFGLDIELTDIRVPTYKEKIVELVLTDTNTKLKAISPYFSKACPEGIEAEIVYIGEGRENDYNNLDVSGKIVVLNEAATGWDFFWLGPFSRRAAIHGAVGLIIIHPFPWPNRMSMEAGNLDIRNRFVDQQVPAVCISGLDGLTLMQHIGLGKTNTLLKIDSEIFDVDSTILSGVLKGSQLPEERIALIGHRDGPIPPAANDNGSGIACQLEVARVLSKFKPKRSVEFICSTGEEGSAPGAWHFVQANKERLPNLKALINLDMLATGGRICLAEQGQWHDTEPIEFTPWLLEMLENVADELGYYVGRLKAETTSEETRFLMEGVPAAWFFKWDDYYYHSEHDSPEKIDPNSIKAVADIVAISIWRLANE